LLAQEEMISESIKALWIYCQKNDFCGYDPHDALNSPYLHLPGKLPKQIAIQLLKRSPVNPRKLFGVKKGHNPKGLGLFFSGASALYRMTGEDEFKSTAYRMAEQLARLKSDGYSGYCWGYNFDWQSRAFYLPKFTPTIVATAFIGNAFFDAYEALKDEEFLKIAISAAKFIANDIKRTTFEDSLCFSYSPRDKSQVHNANMLGAAYLAKAAFYEDNHDYAELAFRAVEFSLSYQRPDGSWLYGISPSQNWIDNFHTGYMIDCLGDYIRYSSRYELERNFRRAARYYAANLFTDEGAPKYYPDQIYPIDIHSCSQAIITLSKLALQFEDYSAPLEKCLNWTLHNMRDPSGYFYFQKNRFYTNHISYMRWSQAWMLKALIEYCGYLEKIRSTASVIALGERYELRLENNRFSFERAKI